MFQMPKPSLTQNFQQRRPLQPPSGPVVQAPVLNPMMGSGQQQQQQQGANPLGNLGALAMLYKNLAGGGNNPMGGGAGLLGSLQNPAGSNDMANASYDQLAGQDAAQPWQQAMSSGLLRGGGGSSMWPSWLTNLIR